MKLFDVISGDLRQNCNIRVCEEVSQNICANAFGLKGNSPLCTSFILSFIASRYAATVVGFAGQQMMKEM